MHPYIYVFCIFAGNLFNGFRSKIWGAAVPLPVVQVMIVCFTFLIGFPITSLHTPSLILASERSPVLWRGHRNGRDSVIWTAARACHVVLVHAYFAICHHVSGSF